MANTYADYTGDGSNTDFVITFDYIKTSHVVVEVNEGQGAGGLNKWVRKTLGAGADYTVVTSPTKKVVFNSPPGNNVRVRVLRDSDASTGIVDFENGSVLTETELDNSYTHNRYLAEEAEEGITGGSLVKNTDGQFDADGLRLENLADPDSDDDAVNKGYADARYVDVAGDTMTGNLDMGGPTPSDRNITGVNSVQGLVTPASDNHAANKKYVDDQDALQVTKTGDTMSGALTLPGTDPTDGNHAVRKSYVDSQILATLATGVAGGPIDTVNIADGAVTFAKLQNIDSGNVIGRNIRNPADIGDPEEIPILDEDDMATDSDQSLATQQSIKAYVDNSVAGIVTATDLGVTHNEEDVTVTSSTGDAITLDAAVASNGTTAGTAGVMTDGDKEKLDGIATGANNYSHPNHTGDVTSVGDGATTIANNAVTAAKISSTDNTFKVDTGSVVINEGGADVDFRVEGNTDANLLLCDAGNDRVVIGGTTPTEAAKFAVLGNGSAIVASIENANQGSGLSVLVIKGPNPIMQLEDTVGPGNSTYNVGVDNNTFYLSDETGTSLRAVSIRTVGSNSVLNLPNIPTSSAGLTSGDVWRNGSVLNIVP